MSENQFIINKKSSPNKGDRSDAKIIMLIAVFCLLIITSLIMMMWNNKKIEKGMDSSVKQNNEVINASQECLSESSVAQRMLLNLAIIVDTLERSSLKKSWAEAHQKNDAAFSVLKNYFGNNSNTTITKAEESKTQYIKSSEEFLALTQNGDRNKISEFLLKDLKPKYEQYQVQQKAVFEQVNTDLMVRTEEISKSSNLFAWIIFGIGISPFIFIFLKTSFFVLRSRI